MDKKPDLAIKTYDTGLELYPNSGILHLERGNMEFMKEEYSIAMEYYERGIKVDPKFPSNYYWSAKLYMNSSESVWGMIYGEIFMNLERNSARTDEISEMLYNTYKSKIQFTSDNSMSVSFSKFATITLDENSDPDKIKLPYGVGVYEPILLLSIISEKGIDISSLNRIRTQFVNTYFEQGKDQDYPNVLFDYQKQILDNGHIESYNHWILMKGEKEAFSTWHNSNKDKFDDFINWFRENPIKIDDENKFHREQY